MNMAEADNIRHHAIRTLSTDGSQWPVWRFRNLNVEDKVQAVFYVRSEFDNYVTMRKISVAVCHPRLIDPVSWYHKTQSPPEYCMILWLQTQFMYKQDRPIISEPLFYRMFIVLGRPNFTFTLRSRMGRQVFNILFHWLKERFRYGEQISTLHSWALYNLLVKQNGT